MPNVGCHWGSQRVNVWIDREINQLTGELSKRYITALPAHTHTHTHNSHTVLSAYTSYEMPLIFNHLWHRHIQGLSLTHTYTNSTYTQPEKSEINFEYKKFILDFLLSL